jgi:hypothetical protein
LEFSFDLAQVVAVVFNFSNFLFFWLLLPLALANGLATNNILGL